MRKRLKLSVITALAVVNVAVILLMAFTGYAGHYSPAEHPRLAVLTLTFPAFMAANGLLLVVWLLVRSRWVLLPLAGWLVCFTPSRNYLPLNVGSSDTTDCIKVLSYNVGGFHGGDDEDPHKGDAIVDYLVSCKADIICLQEAYSGFAFYQLSDTLNARYPYRREHKHAAGETLVIFSRYPIIRDMVINYQSAGNMSAAYWLDIDGEPVVVVNNHLETNHLSLTDRANFRDIVKGDVSTSAAQGESRHLLETVARAGRLRAPQADSVAHFIQKVREKDRSVIALGDFNDSPLSYSVATIGNGLTNCYVSTGNGPGWSYHKNMMLVRIDHLFCSDDWEPRQAQIDRKIAASDHYPIYCWLKKRIKH